mgnify:FL=1
MIKACIFDLDGTIADTVESIAVVGNRLLSHYGLKEQPVEGYNFFAGDGADELVRRILEASGGIDKVDYEEAKQIYRKWFEEDPFYHVKPFDGIVEMLNGLKKEGIKIGVCSNKPHHAAVDVVNKIFGEELFDYAQGQKEGIRRKPEPDGVWYLMEQMHVSKEECLYIGDSEVDAATGRNAGLKTIGVLWGFRDRKTLETAEVDDLIDRPDELLQFV